MANTTHKRSSKKSSAKTPAKRRISPASKTKKLSKAVRKTGNGKAAAKKAAAKKAADEEREKAYKESLRKIPDSKTSSDPWGGVRSGDAPKTAVKSPGKPKTKTGSNAN